MDYIVESISKEKYDGGDLFIFKISLSEVIKLMKVDVYCSQTLMQ